MPHQPEVIHPEHTEFDDPEEQTGNKVDTNLPYQE